MSIQLIESGVSPGAIWSPKIVRHEGRRKRTTKAKSPSLAELKQKLAGTRTQRLAAAKENCLKLTGKQSF
jgi:hypothetical protein